MNHLERMTTNIGKFGFEAGPLRRGHEHFKHFALVTALFDRCSHVVLFTRLAESRSMDLRFPSVMVFSYQ